MFFFLFLYHITVELQSQGDIQSLNENIHIIASKKIFVLEDNFDLLHIRHKLILAVQLTTFFQ